MGIPKFFRYISERYPLTSQLITENRIPEFDNLYLDFNGIIHNCSHPNDDDAHFRVSEEQIFTSIFSYVDLLFGKIKPKKLFFMAVDGVAPRAKMNQQRSRRFRTAKEARDVREKALKRGEKLPDQKAFDSNCITPGTTFMARLSDQLRYFINKKITEDSQWRDVQVVLSGHEVPGEGEHKIMEYIRLSRAQPDYSPNVRHCLYGLDADLIMLGLLSHDPHFCLLREEVKFGPASKKKNNGSLESLNFYLLHLSLMREYLDLEFRDIEQDLSFTYNLERIIDDFILLAIFVGNDFLPNLPDLHIHENGLERLFDVYKKALPSLDGYLNEGGVICMRRLQAILNKMTSWEEDIFQKEYADQTWFKGKQVKHVNQIERERQRSKMTLTKGEKDIFNRVKTFILDSRNPSSHVHNDDVGLTMPNVFPARERRFITTLAKQLRLQVTWDEYDDDDHNLVTWRLPPIDAAVDEQDGGIEGTDVDDEDEESKAAVDRVLKRYEKAHVTEDDEPGDFDARQSLALKEKMDEWKNAYYKEKLGISYNNPTDMGDIVFKYFEGLQWVIHYYYSGVASWGWFYNYHYAPRISDLKGADEMSFDFELGTPFLPFQQLMGVMPAASKELIPETYRNLMDDPNSPIFDFYPTEFELDLNGKKQDWEAIVKIPFIDQERLIAAMSTRDHGLTPGERQRNSRGTSTRFSYNPDLSTVYPSSLPGFFPPIYRCKCAMEPFDLPTLDGLHLVDGLCDGVVLGAEALAGFPSLNTLPHTAQIGFHGVNVHSAESRNKSVVVHIENPYEDAKSEDIANAMVGKRIFTGWPFLQEGSVVAVSDSLFKYEKMAVTPDTPVQVISNPHALGHWKSKAERIEQVYSKRCGVITGNVNVLLHVRPLKGLTRLNTGAFVKEYEGSEKEVEVAVQMAVSEIASEDPRYIEREAPSLSEEFPEGSKIFFLGEHAYGVAAQVSATTESNLSVILAFFSPDKTENEQFKLIVNNRTSGTYYPSFKAAEIAGITGRALSKITSSFMVITSDGHKTNLGLSLKFEAKALKVIDYSRKAGRYWEFSQKAIDLIREYKAKYPDIFRKLDSGGDEMIKASQAFPGPDPDQQVKEVKAWLKSKGVRDFEPVSLTCDHLTKDKVTEIEELANTFSANRSSSGIKRAIVKGIPRRAVLKPSDAVYMLQKQFFELGDRVTMVQDSGGVPLTAKGVVIGLNATSIDVVWDVPFMSGVTLGDRCSQYRGSTVEFNSCLNLTYPQFVASTNPNTTPPPPNPSFKPKFGPHVPTQPPYSQHHAAFRPNTASAPGPVHIITNPNRGGGRGTYLNGPSRSPTNHHTPFVNHGAGDYTPAPVALEMVDTSHVGRGGSPSVRGGLGRGYKPPYRGGPGFDRGRGAPRGGFRGRRRGGYPLAPPVSLSS